MLVRIAEAAGTRIRTIRNRWGLFMRAHHVIAVAAIFLVGFGAKLFFFSAPEVEAGVHAGENARMDVLQMHIDYPKMKDLLVQDVKDPL
jgi:hypothetical protein